MSSALAIGDFSRATHLTVKTLRHYHETGLLEPARVDPQTGYRRYTIDQIRIAQINRRLRDLDMPLSEIRAVISARDVAARNELMAAHLSRLEETLVRTQTAVTSLKNLLEDPTPAVDIGRRTVGRVTAAAISAIIDVADALPWFAGALGELHAALDAQGISPMGSAGGMFANSIFSHARGEATMFVPCSDEVRAVGRITTLVVPAVELATLVHEGPHTNIDLAYGALAAHVTRHALAVDAPLREYYLIGPHDTADARAWRTEIGWPIFQTG